MSSTCEVYNWTHKPQFDVVEGLSCHRPQHSWLRWFDLPIQSQGRWNFLRCLQRHPVPSGCPRGAEGGLHWVSSPLLNIWWQCRSHKHSIDWGSQVCVEAARDLPNSIIAATGTTPVRHLFLFKSTLFSTRAVFYSTSLATPLLGSLRQFSLR